MLRPLASILRAPCRWPRLLGAALALLVAVHGLLPGFHQLVAHGPHHALEGAGSSLLALAGQDGNHAFSVAAGDLDDEAACPICQQLQAGGDLALPLPTAGTCVGGNEPVESLRWLIRQVRGRPEASGVSARGPPLA